jgi:MoaA/NifB/PqqE/SkfB family radical SAM enzyme
MISLKGSNFTKEELYINLREGRLLTMHIFLENVCNFKCPFCLTQTREFKSELTTEETKKLILEGKVLGVRTILIAGAGEPLMAQNFWEIIEFIKEQDLNVVVFSNLSLITQTVAAKLYQNEVSIIGKLNSFNKQTQENYIGNISGAYEKMQAGLKNLIDIGYTKLNEKQETMLALETSVLHDNVNELYDFWVYCRENNMFPIVDTIYYQGKATESAYEDYLVDYPLIKEAILKINDFDKKNGYKWGLKLLDRNGKGVIIGELGLDCIKIGTNLNVDVEGQVYDCFNMSGDGYGNIREKRLVDIWKTHKPYCDGISLHGLCKCRNYTNRDEIQRELACLA